MGIVNLKTDLKSLTYGRDRPGMGDSGQPYMISPMDPPDTPSSITDFLWRGGMNAPKDALKDTERLTKWFKDPLSPKGMLFIVKQNVLSRTSVKTEASFGIGHGMGLLNQGVYTPAGTLGTTLAGFTGTHLNFLGVDPTSPMTLPGGATYDTTAGVNSYSRVLKKKQQKFLDDSPNANRLVALTNIKMLNSDTSPFKLGFFKSGGKINKWRRKNRIGRADSVILSYSGGPNSILGIERTRIMFSDQRTGINSQAYIDIRNSIKNKPKSSFSTILTSSGTTPAILLPFPNKSTESQRSFEISFDPDYGNYGQLGDTPLQDFREKLIYSTFPEPTKKNPSPQPEHPLKVSTIMSISPSYKPSNTPKTIDGNSTSRINQISPGQRGNIINYTAGKKRRDGKPMGPVDKINALKIYQSSDGVKTSPEVNDLIQFRIAAINSEKPNFKNYIHFRAYIDSFSDKYKAKWKPINYMGRGESFYKYDSFDRDISLDFTVAAQSREELMIQYEKLNYLVSNLAPTYSEKGFMGGPLVTLTLGGWLYEQPGFITGLSLGPVKDSPWEIGINDAGDPAEDISELPHIVKVSGFGFTPIHKFRPEKIKGKTGKGNQNFIARKKKKKDKVTNTTTE